MFKKCVMCNMNERWLCYADVFPLTFLPVSDEAVVLGHALAELEYLP